MSAPVLRVEGLSKRFAAPGGGVIGAVNDVSFTLAAGETLGLVGESGSGKSTLGRCVLRLTAPSEGRVIFMGQDITSVPEARCRPLRANMQMVFQDPWAALNPRMTARDLIEEPLMLHTRLSRAERRDEATRLGLRVRLPSAMLDRYPSELSGGQQQRVCIARAIATKPALIVLDEPTSSLDLSVRAGILDLLAELKEETGAAMLFITHDLGTLRLMADRVMVMYLGRVVEQATAAEVFERPAHPYTQALMSAHLPADPAVPLARHVLRGEIPSPINLPPGCGFASRCPVAIPACRERLPPLEELAPGHRAACLRVADGGNRIPS
ncbi:ABC transporter ATP-binding protein [Falsiroseomonas oryziterrae]|uniref:ABC transporter ATP-binding protein n=1 Tax=Falsiroseomonas oryziterrae TaxID=2911368 RepID=UPI001F241D47|nr:ABC transporter ATP-binding protein [Roseomonas sp. NPKOSM-4]